MYKDYALEIVSIYPFLSPPNLTPAQSNRVCNALALLQCVASYPDTRMLFLNGDDHRIMIYYPSSAGGGMKELFRKVGNRSSEFQSEVRRVRRENSYIYEEFMPTGGTDVKVLAFSFSRPHYIQSWRGYLVPSL